jgi:hypothetical protein
MESFTYRCRAIPCGDQLWAGGGVDGATQKKRGRCWMGPSHAKDQTLHRTQMARRIGDAASCNGQRKVQSDTNVAATVEIQNFRRSEACSQRGVAAFKAPWVLGRAPTLPIKKYIASPGMPTALMACSSPSRVICTGRIDKRIGTCR